jgi:hypothetical protein
LDSAGFRGATCSEAACLDGCFPLRRTIMGSLVSILLELIMGPLLGIILQMIGLGT